MRIVIAVTSNEKAIVNNNVIELNEANFDREVLNAANPVLVRVLGRLV